MKYQALLFDADGTLLDFQQSEENSLRKLFTRFPVLNETACKHYYKELNEKLWNRFEQGIIDKQTIFETRFSTLCAHFHLPYDGNAMERFYRKCLNESHELIEGAFELTAALKKQYALYIITNGTAQTQYQRLHDSQLLPFFQDIFVSDSIGYQKPHRCFFAYVTAHIPYPKDAMLVIGDSLYSDISGAKQAGISSVWFHTDAQKTASKIIPDYEIHAWEELWEILK